MLVMDVMDPVAHIPVPGVAGDLLSIVAMAADHRVVLQYQMRVGRRMARKRLDHLANETAHAAVIAVVPNLAVVVHLQRHQEEALPQRAGQARLNAPLLPAVGQLASRGTQPVRSLRQDLEWLVMAVVLVLQAPSAPHRVVLRRVPRHALERARLGRHRWALRRIHRQHVGEARQHRIRIDTSKLEGHVVRPNIAFLEHEHPHPAQACPQDRRAVVGPAVAKQHDGVDVVPLDQRVDEVRPVIR